MNLLLRIAVIMTGLWMGSSAYYTQYYPRPRYTVSQKAKILELLKNWKNSKIHHNSTAKQRAYLESLDYKRTSRQKRQLSFPNCPEPDNIECVGGCRRRKEYRAMTDEERETSHSAIFLMGNTIVGGGLTEYDVFVDNHNSFNAPGAHGGAAFLPWHREYLLRFENGMRRHDQNAVLPYLNSALDTLLPNPADSITWHDDFLGTNRGQVTSGPFAFWTTNTPGCSFFGSLRRGVGDFSSNVMLKKEDIITVMSLTSFEAVNTDQTLEFAHGGVHIWIGGFVGQMGSLSCSPVDPVFFLHHGFIDNIWEEFRQTSQTTDIDEYLDQFDSFHSPNSPMEPFEGYVNRDGVSERYRSCYTYEESPDSCDNDEDCQNTANLFCHENDCKPKVVPGGDCTGLPDKACYVPKSQRGQGGFRGECNVDSDDNMRCAVVSIQS